MIEVKKIREYMEDAINKKIEEIDDPNLNYNQKRLKVLNEMNNSLSYQDFIDFPTNKIELFDIEKIRQFEENIIQEKIKSIKDDKLTLIQKRKNVLDEMNTSQSYGSIEEDEEDKKNNQLIFDYEDVLQVPSLNPNSTIDISNNSTNLSETYDISDELKKYWIKYDLYDVKQNSYIEYPTLEKLEEDKFYYAYNNKLTTYYFIKSVQFGRDYSVNNDVIIDDKFDEKHGLFFCGRDIELDDKEIKKCCPHEMLCRDCMNKNKKRYHLKSRYSININGRASKKYNKSFHCFGHFYSGKQIETCLDKFSCEACKLLDKYEKYYFPDN